MLDTNLQKFQTTIIGITIIRQYANKNILYFFNFFALYNLPFTKQ